MVWYLNDVVQRVRRFLVRVPGKWYERAVWRQRLGGPLTGQVGAGQSHNGRILPIT